jgi:hypothetical protein
MVEQEMIDWPSIFDEAYPVPGATAPELERFVATVTRALTPLEIEEINDGQQNPFPNNDSLYATWQRFDPSLWKLPDHPLPESYLDLLSWSNGGEFRRGERCFQFFPILDPVHGVRAMMLAYRLPQYMPGALPFAFNGQGTFYVFDMRGAAKRGEYRVVCSQCGNLGWEPDQYVDVAESLEAACRGEINVDELWFPESSGDDAKD